MQPFFMLSCNALPEALQTATCIHLLHRHRYCHCRHRRYHFKLLLDFLQPLKTFQLVVAS